MFLVKCYAHFIFNTYCCQISLYIRYADVYPSHWWMKGPGVHTFLTLHIIILFILCQSDKIKIVPHCNFNLVFSCYTYGWIFISLQVISVSSTVNCHFLFLPSEKLALRLSHVFQIFFFYSCRLFLIVGLLFAIRVTLGKLLNLSESKLLIYKVGIIV